MSDLPEIAAGSEAADPVEALRDALSGVLDGLLAAGCGPHHLAAMTWEAGDPAAFHLSRLPVELAYREVFAGFRPPIDLRPGGRPGLTVRARYAPPAASSAAPAEREALAHLAREYSPRRQADMKALFRQWSRDGAAFRSGQGGLDLAYGPGRYETLDLYRPAGAKGPAPVWVFVHGGYWQASDKAQHAQFARGLRDAGYAVAMPNYGLAPDTPLDESLAQIVAALRFLVREADALGLDAARLHLAGHSAGGQLAAMALLAPEAPPVASALLLSGLYDLAPLGRLPMGRLLGLDDPARAARLGALGHPRPAARLAFAVGEGESDAFKDQSTRLADAWGAATPLHAPGHHFGLLDGLNGGALLELALETAA